MLIYILFVDTAKKAYSPRPCCQYRSLVYIRPYRLILGLVPNSQSFRPFVFERDMPRQKVDQVQEAEFAELREGNQG